MNPTIITALVFLIILSIVDLFTFKWKDGAIPKVLTTSFILFMFILNPNVIILITGVLVALLLTDIFDIWGFADFKALVAVSLIFDKIVMVLLFVFILLFLGAIYQGIMKLLIKYKVINPLEEIPYLPVMLITLLVFI